MSQPTLGRQVSALEEEPGVALFERGARSLELTPAGLDLIRHYRQMGDAASSGRAGGCGRCSGFSPMLYWRDCGNATRSEPGPEART